MASGLPCPVDAGNEAMTTPHEDGWYLAIDLGTGGTKVAAVDGWGNVRASVFASIETTLTPDGGATQDTDQWWLGIVESVRASW